MDKRDLAAQKDITLKEFVQEEKKKDCLICALPEHIRLELKDAPRKDIRMETQIRWLHRRGFTTITQEDLQHHRGGKHDAI